MSSNTSNYAAESPGVARKQRAPAFRPWLCVGNRTRGRKKNRLLIPRTSVGANLGRSHATIDCIVLRCEDFPEVVIGHDDRSRNRQRLPHPLLGHSCPLSCSISPSSPLVAFRGHHANLDDRLTTNASLARSRRSGSCSETPDSRSGRREFGLWHTSASRPRPLDR